MNAKIAVTPIDLPDGRVRAVIERLLPSVDDRRFPVKRIDGDRFMIHASKIGLPTRAAGLLWACSSTPLTQPDGSTATMLPPHLDAKSAISTARSVYCDFDEFALKPQYTALIERHGKYLASKPTLAVTIEGHADERGGSEYNLAIGQKRAEALLRALQRYGVKPEQMEAISWGEERPKAAGHDEASWAQNRRDDLQYPKQ